MTKNKFHPNNNDHMTYLGEISWKVPVTLQVNTRDTRFILGHFKKIPCFPFHLPLKYMRAGGSLFIIDISTNFRKS